MASLLFVAFIVAMLGCVSTRYPDQRAVYLSSPEGRQYTLFETSGHELELHEQRSFERAIISLGVVKKQFGFDTNIVQFIDAQIAHMRHYHEDVMAEQRQFTDTIGERDRVYRFVYSRNGENETGVLILREGRVVVKLIE